MSKSVISDRNYENSKNLGWEKEKKSKMTGDRTLAVSVKAQHSDP